MTDFNLSAGLVAVAFLSLITTTTGAFMLGVLALAEDDPASARVLRNYGLAALALMLASAFLLAGLGGAA